MHFVTLLWKNLFRRPVRSLLTVLGVALAVGTLLLLRGVSLGFEKSFEETLSGRGLDIMVVASGVPDQLRSDLDEAIGDQLREIPGIKAVNAGLIELIDIERRGGLLSVLVHGWEPGSSLFKDLEMPEGRTLQADDQEAVILGETLAENLKSKIGDEIILQGDSFRVVGIYRSRDVFENGSIVILLDVLQRLMAREGGVTGFSVQLTNPDPDPQVMDRLLNEIESLKDPNGKPYRIKAEASRNYISGMVHIRLAKGMAWFTSAVAIVIGSIGMLNTMLTSVMERTREIGILRAIGWKRRRILQMILGEATVVCFTGSLVGILGTVLLLKVLTHLPRTSGWVSGSLAPQVVVEGLLLTIVVTLLGGLYPAWRASRLLPTEALRYE